jgi:hypothetical protein
VHFHGNSVNGLVVGSGRLDLTFADKDLEEDCKEEDMEFDSFYIKFGGLDDEGYHDAKVIVGFLDENGLNRNDIEIPVRLKADLDVSLRKLREQVKVLALRNLQTATQLLEQFSADQLHSKGQDAFAESKSNADADWTQNLTDALENSSLGKGRRG